MDLDTVKQIEHEISMSLLLLRQQLEQHQEKTELIATIEGLVEKLSNNNKLLIKRLNTIRKALEA